MRKKCVPKEGLEPSPGVKPDWILSPARLPIPPLRQIPLMVYQPRIFQRFQDVNILHESPSRSPEATKSTFTRLWWEFRHFGKEWLKYTKEKSERQLKRVSGKAAKHLLGSLYTLFH